VLGGSGTWTVGDQQRSYQPVSVPTRDDADQMAADMAETFWHFPKLTILVDFDPAGVPTDLDKRPSQPHIPSDTEH